MKIGDFMRRAVTARTGNGKLLQEPCTRESCRAARRNRARLFYRKPVAAATIARAQARAASAPEPAWVGMVLYGAAA